MARSVIHLLKFFLPLMVLQGCGSAVKAPVDHIALDGGRRSASGSGGITVQAGDSLWLIARRNRIDLTDLISANNLKSPYIIQPGQRLRLPRKQVYTVRPGDSLYAIAERHDLGRHQLARANRLSPPYRIFPGQQLVLPRNGDRVMVAAAPTKARTAGKTGSRRSDHSVPVPASRPASGRAAVQGGKTPEPVSKPSRGGKRAPVRTGPERSTPGKLTWPVAGRVISRFGPKKGGLFNDGINLAVAQGTSIRSAGDGTVVYAGNELRGFGNLLLVRHGGGLTTAYAHNQTLLVARGDRVRRGQSIARAGQTGGVDLPQLHFEIRKGKRAIDPVKLLGRPPAAMTSSPGNVIAEGANFSG